jgi:RNA polymerase sigma-70 factor (ECF subfamily)
MNLPQGQAREQGEEFSVATRASLLERLRDLEDQGSWQRFYERYARLIHRLALKSGLTESEADEVLQETVISAAKHLPGFQYNPAVCSFKTWLLRLTRWRIVSQLRKRSSQQQLSAMQDVTVDEMGSQPPKVNALYEEEWRTAVLPLAVSKVKKRINPEQYQIFDLYALRGMDVREVTSLLGISRARVYLTKHRVAEMLKQEISALEAAGW